MTAVPFKFDEIGYWSELKLEIVEKYGSAYTKTFKRNRLKKYYIDGFSGAGVHLSKKTTTPVEGSPLRALKIYPPFDRYYFIDLDEEKTSYLQKICGKLPQQPLGQPDHALAGSDIPLEDHLVNVVLRLFATPMPRSLPRRRASSRRALKPA